VGHPLAQRSTLASAALVGSIVALATALSFAVASIGFFASVGGIAIVAFWSVLAGAVAAVVASKLKRRFPPTE
jgi:hypothetical protein